MLGDKDAIANVAVKNLDVAKKFYEGTLGLKQVHVEGGELIVYKSGNTTLNVYVSRYAGTNKATAVTWTVGDKIDETVRALKAKGVTFEHYDMPGMKVEGDITFGAAFKAACSKDPAVTSSNVGGSLDRAKTVGRAPGRLKAPGGLPFSPRFHRAIPV